MLNYTARIANLLNNAAVSTTGVASSNLDTSNVTGQIILGVTARVSGTNAVTVAVEHSLTGTGDWAAVPAAAITNVATGAASAFGNIGTAAYVESRAVDASRVRRYVRVNLTGATLTHVISVNAAYDIQNADGTE